MTENVFSPELLHPTITLENFENKVNSTHSGKPSKLLQIWKNGQYWQSFYTSEIPKTLEDLPKNLREIAIGLLLYYGSDLDRSIPSAIIENAETDLSSELENEFIDIHEAFETIKRFLNRQSIIEQRKTEGFVFAESKSFRPTDLMVGSQRKLNPAGFLSVKDLLPHSGVYSVFLGEPLIFVAENNRKESLKPREILLDVKNDQQKAAPFLQKVTETDFSAVFIQLGIVSVSLQGTTCIPLKFVVR